MVEKETEPMSSSEESQTLFEGQQALLQPPPLAADQQTKRKKRLIWGAVGVGLLMVIMVVSAYLARSKQTTLAPETVTASPTPAPVFLDQAKETELERVEEIVKKANPETLLIPPPQVDMAVEF